MTIKKFLKNLLFWALNFSINQASKEQKLQSIKVKLEKIIPDLTDQYSSFKVDSDFLINKVRTQHAFQINLAIDAIKLLPLKVSCPTVVDIGDSSGAHLMYLKNLLGDEKIRTISVNSDPIAVNKIEKKGLQVINTRAELLHQHPEFKGRSNIFLSFEMIEHLIDPIRFLHNMSTEGECDYFVITVPYVVKSRVGLHQIRNQNLHNFNAEATHIFELSPEDWNLIFKFSGWKIIKSIKYTQYPKYSPYRLLSHLWRKFDFEGFYGVILKQDNSISKNYADW